MDAQRLTLISNHLISIHYLCKTRHPRQAAVEPESHAMKKRKVIWSIAACLASAGLFTISLPARAQDYPSKLIRIIVPFPPGALTDTLARLLGTRLQEKWGQPVVVENRAGAGGIIGTDYVYQAAPDGYTLLFTPQSTLVTAKLVSPKVVRYEPDAFVPVSVVTRFTLAMMVNPKVPANNLQQFISYAAANPGKLNYASTGAGSTAQLTSELFNAMGNTKIMEVPYQGISPAMIGLMSGQVDMLFDAIGNGLPYLQSGKIKVLGVAGEKRSSALPDVPAITEVIPGFVSTLWTGVALPPKTPAPIAAKLSAAISEALKHPDFIKGIEITPGMEAVGSTPDQMAKLMKSEREQWHKVIKANNIKAD